MHRHWNTPPASTMRKAFCRLKPAIWAVWICLLPMLQINDASSQAPIPENRDQVADEAPITPVPQPPPADPRKLALGETLFRDRRLSHDGTRSCLSCHDIRTNGAARSPQAILQDNAPLNFNIPTVFNAALSFRLNWEGNARTLEQQARLSIENQVEMGTSVGEVLEKLNADPAMIQEFRNAYGHPPDQASLLDAIATFERSLLTPGCRFDQWLGGNSAALTPEEHDGYKIFLSLGCISCHQGVNVGANLYQRHGIFSPLAAAKPEILRVPSLRNVATTAPYFHDGSAPTLDNAVRKMARAQLDQNLTDQQVKAIVAFLGTLTGNYRGSPVVANSP